jgi:hypothetical protein
MGGQACILYGGAEFSRDLDLSIGVDAGNLAAVKSALAVLEAETVFVPELDEQVLRRGHACHFRCHADGVEGLRIDLMAKMRGCTDFDELWKRRSIVQLPEIGEIGLLSLPDLIQAKKTQREKDWPMIRRLIETDVAQNDKNAAPEKIVFWLRECRTPVLLVQLARQYAEACGKAAEYRPLLIAAREQNLSELESLLLKEEMDEREKDREYWRPLRGELEQWRRGAT